MKEDTQNKKRRKNYKRIPCLHGCGTSVLRSIGECRKCRRQRVVAGLRKVAHNRNVTAWSRIVLYFKTLKQKYDYSKKLSWNKPKGQSLVREKVRLHVFR